MGKQWMLTTDCRYCGFESTDLGEGEIGDSVEFLCRDCDNTCGQKIIQREELN